MATQIRDTFRSPQIRLLPFDAGAAEHFADIRARLGVSPADAIHLACAAQAGADVFTTNDAKLVRLDAGLF